MALANLTDCPLKFLSYLHYNSGTKCLSGTERLAGVAAAAAEDVRHGILVNDSHAEVLARRILVRWCMGEIRKRAFAANYSMPNFHLKFFFFWGGGV
jgi:hypothetical protein